MFEPGTVIRIWAWDKFTKYWQKLWSGPPQCCNRSNVQQNLRMFTPPLAVCQFKTRRIRLELNHSLTGYYSHYEGVLLFGTEELIVPNDGMINAIPLPNKCEESKTDSESNWERDSDINSDSSSYLNLNSISDCSSVSDSNSDYNSFMDFQLGTYWQSNFESDSQSDSMSDSSLPCHKNDTHNLTPYGPSTDTIFDDIQNFKAVLCKGYSIGARYTNDSKIFLSSTVVTVLNIL